MLGAGDIELRRAASVLVLDDDLFTAELLDRILRREGYTNVHVFNDPLQALAEFSTVQPDIVLLDLHMPNMTGVQVLKWIREEIPIEDVLPVIVLTADLSTELKHEVLTTGATDFLTKPFDRMEVLLRIQNALHTRILYQKCIEQTSKLEDYVRERTRDIIQAQMEIIDRLGAASEIRDDTSNAHISRVGDMAASIAEHVGLPQPQISTIRRGAPLHDVGKIGIPDHILRKPGKLTEEEFELMKQHTLIGARILSGSRFPVLQVAERIALTHHENWDGSGYPNGIRGNEIPIEGRIVALADVFDALIHDRPYKKAWSVSEAIQEIQSLRGKKFDPQIVDAFYVIISQLENGKSPST